LTGDDEPRDAAPQRGLGAGEDEDALVERLRAELRAARERVGDAWQRYRREAPGPDRDLRAIAGCPLLPVLVALLQ